MSVKTVAVPVSEKAFDLTQHLAAYVKAVKQAVADGFQPGQDVPAIISATIQQGLPVIQDLPSLGNEKNENALAFAKAFAIGAVDVAEAALS